MPLCNTEKLFQKINQTTYIISDDTDGRPYFFVEACQLKLEVSHCTDIAHPELRWLDSNYVGNPEVLRDELTNIAIGSLLVIPNFIKIRTTYVLKGNTHCEKKAADVWEIKYQSQNDIYGENQ